VNYKLRDWLFSRQRYWGEPFPILLDEAGNATAVSESELPLTLPELTDFRPTGTPEPPLSKAREWVNVVIDGKRYTRENQYHAAMGGFVLVLPALHRSAQQSEICRPGEGTILDARRSLYRRRRACGPASALLALSGTRCSSIWVMSARPEPFGRLVNQG